MNNAAQITSLNVYSDASGAPAVVKCGAYTFAMDMLGELKCNLVSGPTGHASRKEKAVALAACKAAYKTAISAKVNDAWFVANTIMYA